MNKSLEEYHDFVDRLLDRTQISIGARRVKEGVWNVNEVPEQEKYNKLLKELTPEQRGTLAEMMQDEYESGKFAVLVYLTDEINLRGLRLVRNGVELAVEPYGTEMYYDCERRRAGNAWPERQLEDKYKLR